MKVKHKAVLVRGDWEDFGNKGNYTLQFPEIPSKSEWREGHPVETTYFCQDDIKLIFPIPRHLRKGTQQRGTLTLEWIPDKGER